MLKVLTLGLFLLTSCLPPVKACDVYPMPVGGMEALGKQIVYPEAARKAGVTGKVLVKVTIAEDGTIAEMEIAQSLSPELDRAALESVRRTQWTPGSKDKQPSACTVMLPIEFKLDEKPAKDKRK